MGLCGSKTQPEEGMQGTTSVTPRRKGTSNLTEERLRAMENDDDLSYMESTGYSAVSMFCGEETARRLQKEYSDQEYSNSDSDYDYEDSDLSERESLLSRQSSTDTLLSSRPGSAESQSSSMPRDDLKKKARRTSAPGVAALGMSKSSATKSFISDRQNSFEDRESEIANALQEIKRQQEEKLRQKRARRQSLRERELAMKQREEARKQGGIKLPPIKKMEEMSDTQTTKSRKKHKKKKRKKSEKSRQEVQDQEKAQSIIAEYEMQSHALQRSRSVVQDNQKRKAQSRRNRAFFNMDQRSKDA